MAGILDTQAEAAALAAALAADIVAGNRAALARAITLVESRHPERQRTARILVQALLPSAGRSVRIGLTGVPGVGKSTLIDALGLQLIGLGHRVAVLAVDPSSARSGGSILGDKTRMPRLATEPKAFIRPSPSAGTLGGTASKTREAMLLCEAAGFDIVLVETVGVGQSETAVADMVDVFVLLMLPGAGDELQGLKKGVIELADIVAVNKADGDGAVGARAAAAQLVSALSILGPASPSWTPPVLTVSGASGEGLDRLWEAVEAHRAAMAGGEGAARRAAQQVRWLRAMIEERLTQRLRSDHTVRKALAAAERDVAAGRLSVAVAAEQIMELLET